jgi:long-chain acyl-CoA synthetase
MPLLWQLSTMNISKFFEEASRKHRDKTACVIKRGFRRISFTYHETYAISLRLASCLARRIKKGDRVLILGPNMPEYAFSLMACSHLGAVVVPVDMRSSEELIAKYIEQTQPKIAIKSRTTRQRISLQTIYMEDVCELAGNYGPIKRKAAVKPADLFEIVYTSGTTGNPKGVMITNDNILSNLGSVSHLMPKLSYYETISILPLSHMLEQLINFFLLYKEGGKAIYLSKVNSLTISNELYYSDATHLVMVPQVMRNMLSSIEKKIPDMRKYHALLSISRHLPFVLRRKLFAKLYRALGKNLQFFAVGGATIDMESAKKWELLGIKIIEGYGATEVTAVATGPRSIKERKLGSIGTALPGVEIRLDDDEIMIKSRSITAGYYKNPEITKKYFSGGWYKTGDIGRLDSKGNLYFVGRDAFKIVLQNGENVYVEDIEREINLNENVKESCVVGINRKGKEIIHASIILKNSAKLKAVVTQINTKLESRQQIQDFSLWPGEDFPRTRTLKIDRKLVQSLIQSKNKYQPENEQAAHDRLTEILYDVSKAEKITEESSLSTDLRLDSLDRAEIVAKIEEEFGVQVNDFDINAHTKIKDLRKIIAAGEAAGGARLKKELLSGSRILKKQMLQDLLLIPLHSLFIRMEIKGKENIRHIRAPSIIIWNHIGLLDGVCCLRILPRDIRKKTAVAAAGYFWKGGKSDYVGVLLEQFLSGFPMADDGKIKQSFDNIGYFFDKGWCIMTAPEGRLQQEGKLQDFRRGVAYLASAMKVPIVPIKISENYFELYPAPGKEIDNAGFRSLLPRKRGKVTVTVGRPIEIPEGVSIAGANEYIRNTIKNM